MTENEEITRYEVEEMKVSLCARSGVNGWVELCSLVDAGVYRGSILESKVHALRLLIGEFDGLGY